MLQQRAQQFTKEALANGSSSPAALGTDSRQLGGSLWHERLAAVAQMHVCRHACTATHTNMCDCEQRITKLLPCKKGLLEPGLPSPLIGTQVVCTSAYSSASYTHTLTHSHTPVCLSTPTVHLLFLNTSSLDARLPLLLPLPQVQPPPAQSLLPSLLLPLLLLPSALLLSLAPSGFSSAAPWGFRAACARSKRCWRSLL